MRVSPSLFQAVARKGALCAILTSRSRGGQVAETMRQELPLSHEIPTPGALPDAMQFPQRIWCGHFTFPGAPNFGDERLIRATPTDYRGVAFAYPPASGGGLGRGSFRLGRPPASVSRMRQCGMVNEVYIRTPDVLGPVPRSVSLLGLGWVCVWGGGR